MPTIPPITSSSTRRSQTMALRSIGSTVFVANTDLTASNGAIPDPWAAEAGTATNPTNIYVIPIPRDMLYADIWAAHTDSTIASITTQCVVRAFGKVPTHYGHPDEQYRYFPNDVDTDFPDVGADFWIPLLPDNATDVDLELTVYTNATYKYALTMGFGFPRTVFLAGCTHMVVMVQTALNVTGITKAMALTRFSS